MNSVKTTLSAIIITFNEEDNILKAIETISFADEIIVLDSFSSDTTIEKANTIPEVKIFQNKFQDFADQRNVAIGKATMDWILFVDADERIPEKLLNEIILRIHNPNGNTAFKIPRKFVIDNKVLNYSGLQSDKVLRLFKRGYASYKKSRKVHEMLNVEGSVTTLKNHMLHYTFKDYNSYKLKAEQYGRLKALELFKKGKRVNLIDLYIKPLYKFCYNYFIRLGFLDGKAGYNICKLNAYGVKYRFKQLQKLYLSSPKQ